MYGVRPVSEDGELELLRSLMAPECRHRSPRRGPDRVAVQPVRHVQLSRHSNEQNRRSTVDSTDLSTWVLSVYAGDSVRRQFSHLMRGSIGPVMLC